MHTKMEQLLKSIHGHVRYSQGVSNTLIARFGRALCSPHFAGTFSVDQIPTALSSRKLFTIIVNLAERGKPAAAAAAATTTTTPNVGHFVAVCVDPDQVHYFDPYGIPPLQPRLARFLDKINHRRKKSMEINSFQVQHLKSKYCGLFCLLYALYQHRCLRGRPPKFRLRFYRSARNRRRNDQLCVEYLSRLISRPRRRRPAIGSAARGTSGGGVKKKGRRTNPNVCTGKKEEEGKR